jgi:hypothetical protein
MGRKRPAPGALPRWDPLPPEPVCPVARAGPADAGEMAQADPRPRLPQRPALDLGCPPQPDREVSAPARRGSRALALSAAASAESKAQATHDFERDVRARTAVGPASSMWGTWQEFHRAWHGEDCEALPLDPARIMHVASMFKKGRYRAFTNYASRAKDEHISQGHGWTEGLRLAVARATRSVTRGLGPGRQSEPLDIFKITGLDLPPQPLSPRGPLGPGNYAVACSFFMLREIESGLARWRSIRFSDDYRIYWVLPTSKVDPMALGITLHWGCICSGAPGTAAPRKPCPYHALLNQAALVKLQFPDVPFDDLPVFPTEDGEQITKANAVETIIALARLCGEPAVDADGVSRFGGHSWRTSGAQLLAGIGLELTKIEILARWISPMLRRYARQAPLNTLAADYKKLLGEKALTDLCKELSDRLKGIEDQLALHERASASSSSSSAALPHGPAGADSTAARLDRLELVSATPSHVVNTKSGIAHRPAPNFLKLTPNLWTTICGWRFGLTAHHKLVLERELAETSGKRMCTTCSPSLRSSSLSEEVAASSGDSSSDSSPSSSMA